MKSAFPPYDPKHPGMSMREHFALSILQVLLNKDFVAINKDKLVLETNLANSAVQLADLLVKELERKRDKDI